MMSGYGPTLLIDYNHVSLQGGSHGISYGAGSNLDFERIRDHISIGIGRILLETDSVLQLQPIVTVYATWLLRVVEKMLEKGEVKLPQLTKLKI